MAVKSSGIIGLNTDIVAEFGTDGVGGIGLTDYYRGGGLVPNTATNSGIAATGQITITSFYNAAAVTYFAVNYNYASGVYDFEVKGAGFTSNSIVLVGQMDYSNTLPSMNIYSTAVSSDGVTSGGIVFGSSSTTYFLDSVKDATYNSIDNKIFSVGYYGNNGVRFAAVAGIHPNTSPSTYHYVLSNPTDFYAVASCPTGGVYAAGMSRSGLTYDRPYIAKISNTGTIVWNRVITANTSHHQQGTSIGVDGTGNVYMSMGTFFYGGAYRIGMSKFDESGTRQWFSYASPNTQWYSAGGGVSYPTSSPKIVHDGRGYAWCIYRNMHTPEDFSDPYFPQPADYITALASIAANGTFEHYFEHAITLEEDGILGLAVSGNTVYVAKGLQTCTISSINATSKAVMASITITNYKETTGTFTASTTSKVLTGAGTLFQSELLVGESLYKKDGTYVGSISSFSSNTSLTLSLNAAVSGSGLDLIARSNIPTTSIESMDVVQGELHIVGNRRTIGDFLSYLPSQPLGTFMYKIPTNLQDAVTAFGDEKVYTRITNTGTNIFATNFTLSTVTTLTPTQIAPTYSTTSALSATGATFTFSNTSTVIL